MIIGCDLGNTNLRVGVFNEGKKTPEKIFALNLYDNTSNEEKALLLINQLRTFISKSKHDNSIDGVIFSSVNNSFENIIHEISNHFTDKDAIKVNADLKLPFSINYDDNYALGADRITNASAVACEFKNQNSLIIDGGTALTFCILLENNIFDGGIIMAGAGISLEALADKTANLEKIKLEATDVLVATNPRQAIISGAYFGLISTVEGIIKRIEKKYSLSFNIILTGGYADIISSGLEIKHSCDPELTMKGLKYIFDLNK